MDANLDTLCTVVYCTADDLLPEARGNARRRISDAEIVTLCVAQSIMGIPSDRRFLASARTRLGHLFPELPAQAAYFKRRRRLAATIEWLMGIFASRSPGACDDLLLIDSTPVDCARSRETVRHSALADLADYGYCASHSRYFWGFRLIRSSLPMALHRRSRWPAPSAMSARSASSCSSAVLGRAVRYCWPTGLRRGAFAAAVEGSMRPSCARCAPMSPAAASTWRPSASVSSRSSGPARICSPSSVTGSHHGRPAGAHPGALLLFGRLRCAQPSARPPQPFLGLLLRLRLRAWNQSSRDSTPRRTAPQLRRSLSWKSSPKVGEHGHSFLLHLTQPSADSFFDQCARGRVRRSVGGSDRAPLTLSPAKSGRRARRQTSL